RVGTAEFVVEDRLVSGAEAAAAVLRRPGQADIAAVVERALPAPHHRAHVRVALHFGAPVRRRVGREPGPHLLAEARLLRGLEVVHQPRASRVAAMAMSWLASSPNS